MASFGKILCAALVLVACATTSSEVAPAREPSVPTEPAPVVVDPEPTQDVDISDAVSEPLRPPSPQGPLGRCLVLRVGPLRGRPEFDYIATYADLEIVRPRKLVRGQRLRVNFGLGLTPDQAATFKKGLVYKAFVGDDVIFAHTVPGGSGFVRPSDIRIVELVSQADVDSVCPE